MTKGKKMKEYVGIICDNSIGIIKTIIDLWNQDCAVVMINMDTPMDFMKCIFEENDIRHCFVNEKRMSTYISNFPEILFQPIKACQNQWLDEETYDSFRVKDGEEDAVILYSSGTTGRGKGIVLSHSAINGNADAVIDYMQPTMEDRMYIVKNFVHSSTFVGEILVALKKRIPLFVTSNQLHISKIWSELEKHKITLVCVNPTLLSLMTTSNQERKKQAHHLKKIYVSGSILDDGLLRRAREVFSNAKIYNVYGMTEMGPRISSQELSAQYENPSVGRPVIGVKIQLRSLKDNKVIDDINQDGQIYVQSPYHFTRYTSLLTDALFDEEGWFATGDVGYFDSNQNLSIVGRVDNMVTCSGHNVYPENIETMIKKNLPVAECLVVGKKDEIYGSVLICYYQSSSVLKKQIYDLCKKKLSSYEIPKKYVLVDEFIKSNGKIKRSYYKTLAQE